ncbi:metal ABC transporter solute-binding protein, Zn/Mn family [Lacisediminihabitans changchengi]|uniref:Zinc ABC transporter substrate-binding protein n=1 Tax=Lacisediminihabitans changchengi TaxID=2787634 RepID=A0A934SNL8_9MICO|nr:zinc ABC transporter substrate-binding protein [Lacisediminihabitans changchengi]MBK4348715.1 zinc ABC transporter substrate-binding protein [Lacisediminihabitans changchengi]
MRIIPTSAVLLVAALALTGCAASSSAGTGGPIRVVASTNVFGDIVKQIGGSAVAVTSLIEDPSQDPHSFEADGQVQLALSKAQVVIENGGGYDDFVDTLLKGASNKKATVLNAATISGLNQHPSAGEFNEHLWYDFPVMTKVAEKIEASLSALDASKKSTFAANTAAFVDKLATLEASEATIKSAHKGEGVAITEPVPLYLLEASGLVNATPAKFSEAVEEGTDVSPLVLRQTLALFTEHTVKLLVYNEQTDGPETEQVLAAAKKAKIAIVPVTETLPAGKSYVSWMTANLAAISAALG